MLKQYEKFTKMQFLQTKLKSIVAINRVFKILQILERFDIRQSYSFCQ